MQSLSYLATLDANSPVNFSHPLNQGLVGWWMVSPFGHPGYKGGNTLRDLCPRHNRGTLVNSPTWSGNRGRLGGYGCLTFDGSSTGVSLTSIPYLPNTITTWTISAWAKSTSSGNMTIFCESNTGDDIPVYLIAMNGGYAVFYWRDNSWGEVYLPGTYTINDGKWHHICATRSGSDWVLYVDGVSDNSTTYSATTISLNTCNIGRFVRTTISNYFNGQIDDVRVLRKAYTASEVQRYYRLSRQGYYSLLNVARRSWMAINRSTAQLASPVIEIEAILSGIANKYRNMYSDVLCEQTVMHAHGYGWPTVDTSTRVRYGGLPSSSFFEDSQLSGGTSGRTFIGLVVTERMMQDGEIRQCKVQTTSGGSASGVKFKVFRINGSNFDFVGESNTVNLAGGSTETFTLSTTITGCRPGDILGIYVPNTGASILTVKNKATYTTSIRYTDGDITTTNAFSSTINDFSLNLEFLGAEPLSCCTGDSIIAGHNVAASHWRTYYDTDGPAGVATAEPYNQLRDTIPVVDFTYQNFAKGGETFAWVLSTGMPACSIAKGPIVIHCGVNDVAAGRTWPQIESDLNGIKALLTGQQKLFINEILPWTNGNDSQAATVRTYNTNLATWCNNNNAVLILCHDAMGQIRGSTGQLDDLATVYDYDGVHITQAGVDELASIIELALDTYYTPDIKAPSPIVNHYDSPKIHNESIIADILGQAMHNNASILTTNIIGAIGGKLFDINPSLLSKSVLNFTTSLGHNVTQLIEHDLILNSSPNLLANVFNSVQTEAIINNITSIFQQASSNVEHKNIIGGVSSVDSKASSLIQNKSLITGGGFIAAGAISQLNTESVLAILLQLYSNVSSNLIHKNIISANASVAAFGSSQADILVETLLSAISTLSFNIAQGIQSNTIINGINYKDSVIVTRLHSECILALFNSLSAEAKSNILADAILSAVPGAGMSLTVDSQLYSISTLNILLSNLDAGVRANLLSRGILTNAASKNNLVGVNVYSEQILGLIADLPGGQSIHVDFIKYINMLYEKVIYI